MNSKGSRGIVTLLIESGVIEASDRELYEYAIHSLWLLIAPLLLALVFGILMGAPWKAVLMILPFMAIRKFSGGFHAKREHTCLIVSSLLIVLCIYAAAHLEYSAVISICLMLAGISLITFSPIDSENRRLDDDEKIRYKVITAVMATVFAVLHLVVLVLGLRSAAVCIAVGLILPAGLQIPCVVMRLMKIEY